MGRKTLLIIGIATAAAAISGASIAVASNAVDPNGPVGVAEVEGPGHDDDGPALPLSAEDRDRAGQAALASVGQGRVGEVERENEGGAVYEADIILPDGSEVDVEMGADFQVLRTGAPERD